MPPVLVSSSMIDDTDSCFTVPTDEKPFVLQPIIINTGSNGTAVAPRKGGKVRRRHSVDFAPPAEMHKVIEFEPAQQDVKEEIWYSKDDYDIIKARNSLIVKMMKKGDFKESDEHSFRGLEHKLKDGHIRRRANKFNALNAVLEEQDRQYARGTNCLDNSADNIALKYEREAVDARETAFTLGVNDAKANGIVVVAPEEELSDEDSQMDDGASTMSEFNSVCSEDSQMKKTRLKSLFSGISKMKSHRASRRASM